MKTYFIHWINDHGHNESVYNVFHKRWHAVVYQQLTEYCYGYPCWIVEED